MEESLQPKIRINSILWVVHSSQSRGFLKLHGFYEKSLPPNSVYT